MKDSELKYAELPGASPLCPPLGICPGPTGGLKVLCRPPAIFFMSLAWEKAFGLLQTQFGTHKNSGMTMCLEKPLNAVLKFYI